MAKKKIKHQSFKLSPHGHSTQNVILYIILVSIFAVVVGYLLKDNFAQVLGISTGY